MANILNLYQFILIFARLYAILNTCCMNESTGQDKEISALGEFGLIRFLTRDIKLKQVSTKTGVGDDAAVLDYSGSQVVVTTDLLTEGIHFNLVYTPLKHLGYKAAVVNFSDIYAMNAQPRQLLVSVAISRKFSVPMMEDVFAGIRLACEQYGVDLVGGDTTSSLTGMTISCTAVGEGVAKDLVYRSGARKNDLICVSGDLGAAYLGLQVLERERRLFEKERHIQPMLEGYDYVLERQLKPEARQDIIKLLRELAIRPTAMIDISDGLSSDLLHICEASKLGCKIFSDKIPVNPEAIKVAREFDTEPVIAALNGGEDYELLFTLPVKEFDKIGNRPEITIIGHMVDAGQGCSMITSEGNSITVTAMGWNALR
jgi:thiamine-monophosphate kinase